MDDMDLKLCIFHNSPLKLCIFHNSTKVSLKCEACCEDHHEMKQGYKCDFCDFYVHEECINTNIHSRHKHSLKLHTKMTLPCCLCKIYMAGTLHYHCSRCSFHICIHCAREPLIFNYPKAHEHKLHQTPIKLSFTCDACGLCTEDYPCICLQCCFVIHRTCIFLPRVIYINRHDHRISHVSSLGPGNLICGVCLEPVNGECGAYSCLVCSYVVHSKCATNKKIWNGRELEGVPEEEESKPPFEVIGQNLIKHFSHDHNLKMSISSLRPDEDALTHEEDERCYACALPLNSELGYKCTECDFILHNECANLPREKRYMLITEKLTLFCNGLGKDFCRACERLFTGFSYISRGMYYLIVDVRCASISDPFKHESHPHWLLYDGELRIVRCEGCGLNRIWPFLRCKGNDDCGGFSLCFRCATLPTLVRHKYDEHPLSLHYGEKNMNIVTYCCGICEEEINSRTWFYGCKDCGSTLHTNCVFQNLIHYGYSSIVDDTNRANFLPNNRLSRPSCYLCKKRCTDDLLINDKEDTKKFVCCSCAKL